MDVESGMSGKNGHAVHLNPAKGKGGGAGSRRGTAEPKHFRTAGPCLIVSPPPGHTEHLEPRQPNFTKLFQSLKRRRQPQVRNRMERLDQCTVKKTKKTFPVMDLPWGTVPLKECNVICPRSQHWLLLF